jgi:triosephosphate isomerase
MNTTHLEAIALVQKVAFDLRQRETDTVDICVIPPFTGLRSVQTLVDGDRLPLSYGAQDVSQHVSGAYTGDISAGMLAKLGCTYVVVGHSERRQHHGEDDEVVAAKARATLSAGLVPIVCLGESETVREAGDHFDYCLGSLEGSLADASAEQVAGLVVAYEPVWAIGTGKSADADDAQQMCAALRARVSELFGDAAAAGVRLLYGGSVKPENARSTLSQADVDGALVGGASLVAEDFTAIVRAAMRSPSG